MIVVVVVVVVDVVFVGVCVREKEEKINVRFYEPN